MKKLFFFFLILSISINAWSQKADTTYSFTLKQAIDFALEHQKNVLNATVDAEISKYKVRETVGYGLPQISGSIDVKDYVEIPTQLFPDFISPPVYTILHNENLVPTSSGPSSGNALFPVQFGTQWNATAGVSASQLIFDPSYIVGVKASKTFRELSEKNLSRTKIETAVIVSKAYYLVLFLRERKKVVDANVVRFTKLASDTKALFDNGFVEKIDYDRVIVAKNNAQTESTNFNRLSETADKTLKYQMGLPYTATLVTADSINIDLVKNISEVTEKANPSGRIEYSILKTQERLQEYNLKRYKGQYLPSLFAYGNLSTMAQRNEFDFFNSGSGYGWYPTAFIGATLTVNIFDGMQRENRIHQEKLALRKINNDVLDFENAVNLDVSNNQASLLDALNALQIQEENLALATSIANTTKLKYEQGIGSNIEVLDAETSLQASQVLYFNAIYNAILAKIELYRALGKFNY